MQPYPLISSDCCLVCFVGLSKHIEPLGTCCGKALYMAVVPLRSLCLYLDRKRASEAGMEDLSEDVKVSLRLLLAVSR